MRSTPFAVDRKFRVLQLGSAALYSIGHGANDAQKTMGIIASLLFAKGLLGSDFYVPFWVVLSCQVAMALGTLVGGWRIVKTMGSRITRLKPVQGFCAETAGAMTLYLATSFGVPVSTTHTITGAIMGVGAARRVSAVRWGIAGSIIIAWVITLPAAALIGASVLRVRDFFCCSRLTLVEVARIHFWLGRGNARRPKSPKESVGLTPFRRRRAAAPSVRCCGADGQCGRCLVRRAAWDRSAIAGYRSRRP